jgi:hypothetical protein
MNLNKIRAIFFVVYSSPGSLALNFRNTKQDRQCTYNVTLRRVRETIVVVEK